MHSALILPLFADFSSAPPTKFPTTRYQGSKRKLVGDIYKATARFPVGTALDLYSGTATVALLLSTLGWRLIANDFLLFNNLSARVLLTGIPQGFRIDEVKGALSYLLYEAPISDDPLVSTNFAGIYFTDEENAEIDRFCQNVRSLDPTLRDLYVYAVGQALLMKRPYNLFHRANLDMRTRSVPRSFGNEITWNTPILRHAMKILTELSAFPFPKKRADHIVTSENTLELTALPEEIDLLYLDPPYLNKAGQGVDYCHFYHFLDGLCDYQLFGKYNARYVHRPIVSKPSAWLDTGKALEEFNRILTKWPNAHIVLSYRNDGQPTYAEIEGLFRTHGRNICGVDMRNYKYALSHKMDTKEVLLISSAAHTRSEMTSTRALL